MTFYEECLQIIEENKTNPHPDFYFITLCLKHWHIRRQVYLNMISITRTDGERQLLDANQWGEDNTLEKLIKKGLPLQSSLDLLLKTKEIEREMRHTRIYDRNHLVISTLEKLFEIFLPVWKEEVMRLKIQKDHPEIRNILAFTLNLRPYNDTSLIDFAITLLNENF